MMLFPDEYIRIDRETTNLFTGLEAFICRISLLLDILLIVRFNYNLLLRMLNLLLVTK